MFNKENYFVLLTHKPQWTPWSEKAIHLLLNWVFGGAFFGFVYLFFHLRWDKRMRSWNMWWQCVKSPAGNSPHPGQKCSISPAVFYHLHFSPFSPKLVATAITLENKQTNKTIFLKQSQNPPLVAWRQSALHTHVKLNSGRAKILMRVENDIWNFKIQKEPSNTNFYSAIMSSNKKASRVRGYNAAGPVTSFH